MKKLILLALSLISLLFLFPQPVSAANPTPLTITRTEAIENPDPNQYRFEVYFTPKINTFLPEGGHFSGCAFVYDPINFLFFSQAGWDNDASETESKCVFMENRPAGANNIANYTGKLHIGGGLSSILFDPVGLSDDYTISIPGKPVAPQLNANLPEEQIFFGEIYTRELSFSDTDSTSWTVAVNYGDGNTEELNINEPSLTLQHTYQDFGRYLLQLIITDNHGMSAFASGYVQANYKQPLGSGLLPPSAVISSSGFSNTENIFVKDDGNFMHKVSDTATITVSFDSFSSEYNIHAFGVIPYFEASEAPDGLICQASIDTDKGVFYAIQPFANPNCGYGNGGGGDNAHFEFDLPNDVHRIDSLTYTITSPEGTYFPLQIDYFETGWYGSVYDKPEVNPGGPYEVEQGESITLQGSATRIDDVPPSNIIRYNWDLDNDGSFETSGQNPVFSTENLSAGVYTVALTASKDVQYTTLNSDPVSTTITVAENTEPMTITINASGDTYLRDGAENRNLGAGEFMRIRNSGNNRALVKFDQSELQNAIGNGTILSATLQLTIVDNGNNWGASGRTVDLHRLISPWDEGNGTENDRGDGSGATWNCAIDNIIENQSKNCSGTTEWEMGQPNNPQAHPWVENPTATQTITNNQTGVVEYDVTADVQDFLSGTNQNYGWILKKTNEGQNGQVSFGTKESSSIPQLIITYQP